MHKYIIPVLLSQALATHAFATGQTNQNSNYNSQIDVEELAAPNSNPVTSYLWTKGDYSSRNSTKLATNSATTSPLMVAHTNPIQVMSTVNTSIIFWGASWNNSSFASDKMLGINYWYKNLATSTYKNTVSEYLTLNHTLKAQLKDTTTTASSDPNAVLTEVCKVVANNIDTKGYYPVYSDLKRGSANFCAYHSAGTCGGKPIQFAFFFNLDNDAGCDPASPYAPPAGSANAQTPGLVGGTSSLYQQSQGLAALANVTAHELAETITDPAYFPATGYPFWGGYFDATGSETGDKCAWTFGPSNTGKTPGTVLIGTYDWKLQGEWSNKAQTSGKGGYLTQSGQLRGCITGS